MLSNCYYLQLLFSIGYIRINANSAGLSGSLPIQKESPGLLYSLPNLQDKSEFGYFLIKEEKSSKF